MFNTLDFNDQKHRATAVDLTKEILNDRRVSSAFSKTTKQKVEHKQKREDMINVFRSLNFENDMEIYDAWATSFFNLQDELAQYEQQTGEVVTYQGATPLKDHLQNLFESKTRLLTASDDDRLIPTVRTSSDRKKKPNNFKKEATYKQMFTYYQRQLDGLTAFYIPSFQKQVIELLQNIQTYNRSINGQIEYEGCSLETLVDSLLGAIYDKARRIALHESSRAGQKSLKVNSDERNLFDSKVSSPKDNSDFRLLPVDPLGSTPIDNPNMTTFISTLNQSKKKKPIDHNYYCTRCSFDNDTNKWLCSGCAEHVIENRRLQ